MSATKRGEAAGVHETAKSLADNLRQYIEAQYHIRDEGLIRERHALLEQDATVAQRPYVEATPVYKISDPYEKLPIPRPAIEALTALAALDVGLYPRPYEHQAQALTSFLGEEAADLVIATGTGSGKTESFLMPIVGQLAIERAARPESGTRFGCRAMLLYPMNALVNDQLARIRRLLGNPEAAKVLTPAQLRPVRFGSYTGRTPYPGRRTATRDDRFVKPLFEEFYRKVASDTALQSQLEKIGRWPSKDLDAFYGGDLVESKTYASGKKAGKPFVAKHWDERLVTQDDDRELMMRHEMQQRCPDLLISNYSMLEYMLMRPIERDIFAQTRDWLRADPRNEFVLVLDEAHMYRGAGGAEVALLIRRLCARLEIPRERMRCILTSASLGTGETAVADGERFARDLTGLSQTSARRVKVIQGAREPRSPARPATRGEAQALAAFDLLAFENVAENLEAARHAAATLARALGWREPGANDHAEFRAWLFEVLTGFGPLETLIETVSGKAVRLDALSALLFPECEPGMAQRATDALLALGSHARRADGRVLIPTRLHLFHRGLPGLYACMDPNCSQRLAASDKPTILGRLHTMSRGRCSCAAQARVYELYTHRDCGAAFVRGYVSEAMDFVWHEPSGPLSGSETVDLIPLDILVEEGVHPRSRHKDMWLHVSTGRLSPVRPQDATGFRRVRVPDKATAAGAEMLFDDCPVCMRPTRGARDEPSKVMDHVTKGEAPFTTLVRTQMERQPLSRTVDTAHPNGGRKVLIFSDGRQKAARLARDIPRDIELDVFRRAIARACRRLEAIRQEPKPNQYLYIAFLSVLCDEDLPIFDGIDAKKVAAGRAEFVSECDGELEQAFGGFSLTDPIPSRYRIALLKLLGSTYYSLSGTTVGFVEPTKGKLLKLKESMKATGVTLADEDVRALAVAWVDGLLQEFAFDPSLDAFLRNKAAGYYKPLWGSKGQFVRLFRQALARRAGWSQPAVEAIEAALREQLATEKEGQWFLAPNALRLTVDLAHIWVQCPECTVLTPLALGKTACVACGGEGVKLVDPTTSDYIAARKGFWRQPVQETLDGGKLSNLSVEEHTAQLSNRDRSSVHATTERYELRFQDVLIEKDDRPIDVLSCTTTMEVGVDIGSLVAVALRNVPPQRENYQQRAGRAGRRGASVSTVVTYSQTGPHDSHYFLNPAHIVAGEPRTPEVKVDNEKIARRHVHAYLIQTFFHERIDQGDRGAGAQTASLEKALGPTRVFFHGGRDTSLTLKTFEAWVSRRILAVDGDLRASVAAWLPPSLDTGGETIEQWLAKTSAAFVADLYRLGKGVPQPMAQGSGQDGARDFRDGGDGDGADGAPLSPKLEQEELLEFLFFHGLLPSYAFPTSLCSFLVEKIDKNPNGVTEVRTLQRPQQSISQALSEYAPGRLIVIDKKTYRSGGVFADVPPTEMHRARPLFANPRRLVHCEACSFVRNPHAAHAADSVCPVCGGALKEEAMIEPEVFGPESARELLEDDREQEITYATMAQFPQPVDPEAFSFISCGPNASYTHATDRRLVTVNHGKEGGPLGGFSVCVDCGAAKVFDSHAPAGGPHERPYKLLGAQGAKPCVGEYRRVLLGHDFTTDLLLMRIRLAAPMVTNTAEPVVLHMLEGALHTIAEGLRLAASRHRQLDLDPAEFGAGFRIVPALQDGARMVDLFLYDTLSGGAGYAEVAARNLPAILDATLELLEGCKCDTSCTECLDHFHNQHIQSQLDRKLGASLLRYAMRGEVPKCASPEVQAERLYQLRASLELDSFVCVEGDAPDMPLVVERGGRRLALGCYPGLIGRADFKHSVTSASGIDDHLALNEFVLQSNLPDAHQQVREKFRMA